MNTVDIEKALDFDFPFEMEAVRNFAQDLLRTVKVDKIVPKVNQTLITYHKNNSSASCGEINYLFQAPSRRMIGLENKHLTCLAGKQTDEFSEGVFFIE
jgi:hypothetical protein